MNGLVNVILLLFQVSIYVNTFCIVITFKFIKNLVSIVVCFECYSIMRCRTG